MSADSSAISTLATVANQHSLLSISDESHHEEAHEPSAHQQISQHHNFNAAVTNQNLPSRHPGFTFPNSFAPFQQESEEQGDQISQNSSTGQSSDKKAKRKRQRRSSKGASDVPIPTPTFQEERSSREGTAEPPGVNQQFQQGEEEKGVEEEDMEKLLAKRRESHREVERRRRESINSGIIELANIVPDCDKSKGSVLQKSVEYIKYLQKTNLLTIEQWRGERKDAEERIKALVDELMETRNENQRLRRELELATKKDN